MSQCWLAANWIMSILANFDIVGESLGISCTNGSSYPKTTSRALGTCWGLVFPWWFCSSSVGFLVSIQRHLMMFSGGTWSRRILHTVSVLSQLCISLSLACWNIFFSSLESWCIFTSLLWRFAADTRNAIWCGWSSDRQRSISWAAISSSNCHPTSSWRWKHSASGSKTNLFKNTLGWVEAWTKLKRPQQDELNADLFKNTLGPVKQVGVDFMLINYDQIFRRWVDCGGHSFEWRCYVSSFSIFCWEGDSFTIDSIDVGFVFSF